MQDAVESFLWHCGKFNDCGNMKDGQGRLFADSYTLYPIP